MQQWILKSLQISNIILRKNFPEQVISSTFPACLYIYMYKYILIPDLYVYTLHHHPLNCHLQDSKAGHIKFVVTKEEESHTHHQSKGTSLSDLLRFVLGVCSH